MPVHNVRCPVKPYLRYRVPQHNRKKRYNLLRLGLRLGLRIHGKFRSGRLHPRLPLERLGFGAVYEIVVHRGPVVSEQRVVDVILFNFAFA